MRSFRTTPAGLRAAAPVVALVVAAAVLAPSVAAGAVGVAAARAGVSAGGQCRLADPRIDEASGIAPGLASPGVLYVQNDSGDTNRFFALDARTCRTAATITVTGARNVDWEDIAVGRDAGGTPSVWLADIGDNDARRPDVAVYRVAEPRIAPTDRDRRVRIPVADVWRLRYPGGPADAESFAVAPDGTGYVVTKADLGDSVVYRCRPARPGAGADAAPVGRVHFTLPASAAGGPLGRLGGLLATGAALSRDGSRFAVRTYSTAYVWTVRDGDVAAALRTRPVMITLPDQPQGEGIAFDGSRLLLDSEGTGTAVLSVGVPRAVGAAASASAASSPSSPGRSSSGASKPGTTPSGSSSPAGSYGGGGSWVPGIVVLSLFVLGAIGWWVAQRGGDGRRVER